MATVYLVRDLKHDRLVALKVLAPELTASVGPERFIREIRLTARLDHPHILPVLDSGEDAGRLWYTMPYVEGESLRDRLRRETQLPVDESVRLAGEVADALTYAHRLGIVHRDIKPENILLSQGHARVADFGVARASDTNGETLTGTGFAVGTPAYMAPEQAAGMVDPRSDLYALGSVLYEMLAGEPPYTGPSAQAIIAKRAVGPVPSVRLTRPDVPIELEAIITRSLSPVPAARHRTAAEFAAALRRSGSGSTVVVRPGRWWRRPAAVTATIATVVGAAAIGSRSLVDRPAEAQRMLAVLPFENLGQPDEGAFADGLTLEITNRLAGISGVGVISRASAMQYKGTTKSRREIGRELGVGYVLEGSVQWTRPSDSGVRVRVSPQLVSVDGDQQLWAERYDTEMGDVFDVQSRIAEQVSEALHGTLAGDAADSSARMPTMNSEAYILHLRALGLLERHDPASVRESMALYERAVQLDSSFALAHFYLGVTHYNLWASGADQTPARRTRADGHLERAAALGPDLLEIRTYQGWRALERGDFSEALERFEWVRNHHPGSEQGWWGLGLVRDRQGRFEEAMAAKRKFIELNPRASGGYDNLAATAWLVRNYSDARDAVDRGLAVAPDDIWLISRKARILGTLGGSPDSATIVLESALARLGTPRMASELHLVSRFLSAGTAKRMLRFPADSFALDVPNYYGLKADLARGAGDPITVGIYADSVIRVLEPMTRTAEPAEPDGDVRFRLAIAYATLGRRREAVRVAEAAAALKPIEKDAFEGAHSAAALAYVYALSGDLDRATAQLERLLRIPSPISIPGLRTDPRWSTVRSDPRFQRLIGAGAA
jgi:eukaryotic-like serine/threonine-protein kinase